MGKLTTAPEILQGLGLEPGFGSPLFGTSNRTESARSSPARSPRREPAPASPPEEGGDWSHAGRVTALSFGAAAATWLFGRALLPQRATGRREHPLAIARDIALGATLAAGAASLAGNELRRRQADDALQLPEEVRDAGLEAEVALAASPVVQAAQRALTALGPVETALVGAAVGVTAVLAVKAGGPPSRWSFLSRLLP